MMMTTTGAGTSIKIGMLPLVTTFKRLQQIGHDRSIDKILLIRTLSQEMKELMLVEAEVIGTIGARSEIDQNRLGLGDLHIQK